VFAFPRTRVWIHHDGQRPFATDLNMVTLYNPGQSYRREPLDPAGDLCEWFAVDNETAFEAVRLLDPRIEDHPDRAFRFDRAPSDATTYLMQRELFEGLARGDPSDALALEERVLGLLRRVLVSAYQAWGQGFLVSAESPRRADMEAAMHARRLLAARFCEPVSLAELAGAVGLSRYRLCHVFRTATGTTLRAYRDELRLRAALERLASGCADLTGLALDLGYSTHSHFSNHFARAFGIPPSRVRARLAHRGDVATPRQRSRGPASS
jgi:AraC-like DNA-binding protein